MGSLLGPEGLRESNGGEVSGPRPTGRGGRRGETVEGVVGDGVDQGSGQEEGGGRGGGETDGKGGRLEGKVVMIHALGWGGNR